MVILGILYFVKQVLNGSRDSGWEVGFLFGLYLVFLLV
jgi:hypothetical protein